MTTKTSTSKTSKNKYFCALGCGCFDTNAELQKHIYESHGGEVYDEQHSMNTPDPMAEDIDNIIVEIINKEDHYCIAHSEGQMCCCDPRTDFGVNADPPAGYGGEAQPELTQALVAYVTNKIILELESLTDYTGENYGQRYYRVEGVMVGDRFYTIDDRIAELKALNHRKDKDD